MGPAEGGRSAERLWAYAVSAVMVAATLWPVFRSPLEDSFPHSTYPMFSHARESTRAVVVHALAVHGDGRRLPLSPTLSSGSFEVLQSQALIRRAVRGGQDTAARLCADIARRVAAEANMEDVTGVELATSRYDVLRYFGSDPAPKDRRVHHTCPVPR